MHSSPFIYKGASKNQGKWAQQKVCIFYELLEEPLCILTLLSFRIKVFFHVFRDPDLKPSFHFFVYHLCLVSLEKRSCSFSVQRVLLEPWPPPELGQANGSDASRLPLSSAEGRLGHTGSVTLELSRTITWLWEKWMTDTQSRGEFPGNRVWVKQQELQREKKSHTAWLPLSKILDSSQGQRAN